MRRVALPLVVLAVCALWQGAAAAQTTTEPTQVEVIRVEGPIDRPLLSYIDEHLNEAVDRGAVVVLQLDTPGSLGQDGLALAERIAALPVPVLTWTGPVPAGAGGAGLLLMLASSLASVSPGSQTGPLSPVDVRRPDQVPAGLDEAIAHWSAARGRSPDLAQAEEAMTAQQAIDGGFAELAASSVPDLLNQADGREVMTPAGAVTLRTRIATDDQQAQQGSVDVRFAEIGPVRRVLHAVATPSMAYFLLVFGLACIAFELTQPGFGFAGFSGIGLLVLAGYGLWVAVPTSWIGFAALLAGVGSMALDVRLRRLGPLTFGGLALFVLGSFLAWGDVAESIRISPWMVVGVSLASLLYYGFGLTVAIQSRDRILSTQRGLIGLVGEARGRLAPDGPVFVKGALWRGRSLADAIAPGTPVRVRGVDGLILKVEAEPDAALPPENEPEPILD